jgi:hypothetical protein
MPNSANKTPLILKRIFAVFSKIKITTSIYEVMTLKMIFYFQKI